MRSIGKNKRAQEEMVGFGFIMIIVFVIILIFLGFALRKPAISGVESYEVKSFLGAYLGASTSCEDNFGPISLKDVIYRCENGQSCIDGSNPCDVLEDSSSNILKASWPIVDRPQKGYILNITADNKEVFSIEEGNQTANYKAGSNRFSRSGTELIISFKVYY